MRSSPSSEPQDLRAIHCVRAFEEHFSYLYRAMRRYGVKPGDAEDLVQDVFVAMWRSWHQFDPQRPLQPWLTGIAFRVARNHLRRKWREVPDGEIDTADLAARGDERIASAQARTLVLRALGLLPEKYRVPLALHELDELPVNEVATLLALPRATTYTRLRRARIAFAKLVEALQTGDLAAGPGRRSALLLPGALFTLERTPPPAPAAARRRAEAFARNHAAGTRDLGRRFGSPALRLALFAAGALAVGALALPRLQIAAPPVAAAGLPPADAPVRPVVVRRSAPMFIAQAPAAVLAAPLAATAALSAPFGHLTGHWSFDDDASSMLARDTSGFRHDCLLHDYDRDRDGANPSIGVGSLSTPGPHGAAADLHRDFWLECPQPELTTGTPSAMTVALWVKLRSLPTSPVAFATRQIESGYKDWFFFGVLKGSKLSVSSHAWEGVAEQRLPVELGRWFHAAFTHDRAGVTIIYIDGVPIARAVGKSLAQGRVTAPLTVGAGQFSPYPNLVRQRLDGAISDLQVYDSALAPGEIGLLAGGPVAQQP